MVMVSALICFLVPWFKLDKITFNSPVQLFVENTVILKWKMEKGGIRGGVEIVWDVVLRIPTKQTWGYLRKKAHWQGQAMKLALLRNLLRCRIHDAFQHTRNLLSWVDFALNGFCQRKDQVKSRPVKRNFKTVWSMINATVQIIQPSILIKSTV